MVFISQTRLDDVYSRLLSTQKTAAAVMEDSKLRGILSLENISRYLMIQAALKRQIGICGYRPTSVVFYPQCW